MNDVALLSSYIYDFPSIDDALFLLVEFEELTKEWCIQYPTHRYEYEMFVNQDKSVSFIIKVYHND